MNQGKFEEDAIFLQARGHARMVDGRWSMVDFSCVHRSSTIRRSRIFLRQRPTSHAMMGSARLPSQGGIRRASGARSAMRSTQLAPWSPTEGDPFDARKAAHLLRRVGFGAPPMEVDRAVKEGLEATVEALFDEAEDESTAFAQTFEAIAGPLVDFSDVDQLRGWWAYRMMTTRVPLREKLALFWHGHFATSVDKVEDAHLMHRQVETLRRLAWGNFRDLVLAMARDPAMIAYLDGDSNTKAHPNENFGRELMELFTCGIGHYTEADVQAAARAFTGWHREGGEFAFKADEHDDGRKRFLGKSGKFDGGDVVEILIQHPATPRRIATRLLRFFAAPDPSPEVLDEATALFVQTRLDVKWFLRELFQSRYFFSRDCYRTRISSPAEYAIGAIRTLGVRWAGSQVAEQLTSMGQALFAPPNVKGWDGETKWINSSTLAARASTAKQLSEFDDDGPWSANFAVSALVAPSITEPAEVVDRLAEVLFQGDLPAQARKELVEFAVFSDGEPRPQAFREDEGFRSGQIRALIGLLLAMPEYHAC
jgi:uncharacterized protein (DUF1800 family)